MIEGYGTTFAELDTRASEAEKPYGIITVDCSSPHEYDDGIAVTPLPTAEETYRVQVFAADTSEFYKDHALTRRVIEATESRYYSPDTGAQMYEPMLDEELIQQAHFVQGTIRKALAISFIIGVQQPPSEVTVGTGWVETLENRDYKSFGKLCTPEHSYERFGRAAALIMKHLTAPTAHERAVYNRLIQVSHNGKWRRGAHINEAYMVAANHLVARQMRDEGRLAIYRTHDVQDERFAEIMSPGIATYSTMPGPHIGLGLDVYTRVTSPLRRAEDFMMHGLLRAREKNRPLETRDYKLVAGTIRRLNQRIAADLYRGNLRLRDDDLWDTSPTEAQSLAS